MNNLAVLQVLTIASVGDIAKCHSSFVFEVSLERLTIVMLLIKKVNERS